MGAESSAKTIFLEDPRPGRQLGIIDEDLEVTSDVLAERTSNSTQKKSA